LKELYEGVEGIPALLGVLIQVPPLPQVECQMSIANDVHTIG
jgi:hypothetical protein